MNDKIKPQEGNKTIEIESILLVSGYTEYDSSLHEILSFVSTCYDVVPVGVAHPKEVLFSHFGEVSDYTHVGRYHRAVHL